MGWREAAGVAPKSDWRSAAGVAPKRRELIDPLDGEVAKPRESFDALKPDTALGAGMLGATQGFTLGHGDEAMGAVDAITGSDEVRDVDPAINPNSPAITKSFGKTQQAGTKPSTEEVVPEAVGFGDRYRKARDSYRADNEAAEKAQPLIYGGSKLAANIAVPIPGGTAVGLGGKVVSGAAKGLGFGGALASGESDADLSSGELGDFSKDVAVGGTGGAVGGALGVTLGAGTGKLAEKFGRKAKDIRAADDLEKSTKLAESRLGAYRQKLGEDIRDLERHRDVVANPNLARAERDASAAYLRSDEGRAKATRAARALQEQTPARNTGLDAAKQELDNAPADAAKASEEAYSGNAIIREGVPRAWHYIKPTIGAVVGGALAGPLGAGGGAVIGAAAGRPGRAAANFARNKPVQVQTLNGLASGVDGLGGLAPRGGMLEGEKLGLEAMEEGPPDVIEEPEVEPPIESPEDAALYAEKLKKLKQRFGNKNTNPSAKERP